MVISDNAFQADQNDDTNIMEVDVDPLASTVVDSTCEIVSDNDEFETNADDEEDDKFTSLSDRAQHGTIPSSSRHSTPSPPGHLNPREHGIRPSSSHHATPSPSAHPAHSPKVSDEHTSTSHRPPLRHRTSSMRSSINRLRIDTTCDRGDPRTFQTADCPYRRYVQRWHLVLVLLTKKELARLLYFVGCGVLTVEIEHVDVATIEKPEQNGIICQPKATTIRIIQVQQQDGLSDYVGFLGVPVVKRQLNALANLSQDVFDDLVPISDRRCLSLNSDRLVTDTSVLTKLQSVTDVNDEGWVDLMCDVM
ncbi:hypothetical protein Syun_014466 [Stephania yunnanensis]|uniref:Uncharacterized protein n=1 Tax=Stephania yunnanensis TaxID=152371 RepID=A0AAP0JKG1_9MAGN